MNIKTDNDWTHDEELVTYAHYADNPEETYIPSTTSATKPSVSEYSLKQTYLNPTLYTNYNFSLNDLHNFTVMAGFQAEMMNYRDVTAERAGLTTSDLPVLSQTTDVDD